MIQLSTLTIDEAIELVNGFYGHFVHRQRPLLRDQVVEGVDDGAMRCRIVFSEDGRFVGAWDPDGLI